MHIVNNGEKLVFYVVLDNSYSANGNKPIQNLCAMKDELHKGLLEDTQMLPFFYSSKEICQKTRRGLIFRFSDSRKTDSLDIRIF